VFRFVINSSTASFTASIVRVLIFYHYDKSY
jgi:hypothetical protein